jgi:hypothetical protein
MSAVVKAMWVDSATINLDSYFPENPECFGLWIEFSVGIKDESGADNFRLFICTPEWLRSECGRKRAKWGRHMLIVPEYDLEMIRIEIGLCIDSCTGEDWPTIAQKIARFAAWEFEDY